VNDTPPVCDYEGSGYRTDFWEGRGRAYEDLTERAALRRLLPGGGRRVAHLGAGFGRMTGELSAFDQVIVLDYSRTMLQQAQQRLGTGGRYVYVAADIYRLPLAPGSCDAAVMERVIHHMADVPAALHQIRAILAPGAIFILEYANKRNLKAMLRYALRRQAWNPYSPEPTEFVPLNFDFHPAYMLDAMQAAGFRVERRLAVSLFRLGLLKRLVPVGVLAGLDGALQGAAPLISPSVFTRNRADAHGPDATGEPLGFACPLCGGDLSPEGEALRCAAAACGRRWMRRDGIWDFKEPAG